MQDEQTNQPLDELLMEYELFADKRDEKLRKEAEEKSRKEKESHDAAKQAYEKSEKELADLLEMTRTGARAESLVRILSDKRGGRMYLGTFNTERHGATVQTYTHAYGINLENGEITFYVGPPGEDQLTQYNLTPGEFLKIVRIDAITHLRLALTAEQYKKDLTSAVAGALAELKKTEGAQ